MEILISLPQTGTALTLPETALYNTNTVYKIVEGRLKPIQVKTLGKIFTNSLEPKIIITSKHLQSNDFILISNLPNAHKNKHVNILPND